MATVAGSQVPEALIVSTQVFTFQANDVSPTVLPIDEPLDMF